MRIRVSVPVVALAERHPSGTVLGGGSGALYLALGGDVVALTGPPVPEMPVGIGLEGPPPDLAPGTGVGLAPRGLTWRGGEIAWDGAEIYDPTIREVEAGPWLKERARYIEGLVSAHTELGGVDALRRAIDTLDLADAAEAARVLTGRGGGLTPEGDDLLAASAGAGRALGWSDGWIRSLLAPGSAARTTSLSGSLLRHAVEGRVIAPLVELWDPENPGWRVAADRLAVFGHSTGSAYLTATALVMSDRTETD